MTDSRVRPALRPHDALAKAVVLAALRRSGNGEVAVREGSHPPAVAAASGRTEITVTVHDPASYRMLLTSGSVGLARSYIAGGWDCDDLVGLLRFLTRRLPRPDSPFGKVAALAGRLRGERSGPRADDFDTDRGDIRAHYDIGDEFFALFLDPTMTYSCGIFEHATASMEEASVAKLDRICQKLELSEADEVLEIGTGWGSFALHAASRYGCHIVTTTISDHQFAYASRQVKEAGLERLVTVRNDDYRALGGEFSKLVSIEMIEAVGWRKLDRFFEVCAERLRTGGTMALQAIVIEDDLFERAKRSEDFIKKIVFPGSTIPSRAAITAAANRAGLRVAAREEIGHHYATTLAKWRARLHENRRPIEALGYEEPLFRSWDLYLSYCEAGFAEGRIGDVQLLLEKDGGHAR